MGGEESANLAKLAGHAYLCRARKEDSRPRKVQLIAGFPGKEIA